MDADALLDGSPNQVNSCFHRVVLGHGLICKQQQQQLKLQVSLSLLSAFYG